MTRQTRSDTVLEMRRAIARMFRDMRKLKRIWMVRHG